MRTRDLLWLFLLITLAPASWHAKLPTVYTCLDDEGVPQLDPDSDLFSSAIEPFNLRLQFTPVALALPTAVSQVQTAVLCAINNNVTVSAKCGGHSYASHGLGGEDGHLVIDMQNFNTTYVDLGSGIATVGSGLRTGDIAVALYNHGQRAISHGTCPRVGISGLTLHGGYGLASRSHGLTLDNLVEVEAVLANGSVITSSKTKNEDLFWAMRGAGSSFGIVTSLKFQTFQAPKTNVVFNYSVPSENRKDVKNALTVLQDFSMEDQPAEMNMRSFLRPHGISLEGVYHGSQKDFDRIMKPLLKNTGIRLGNDSAPEDDPHRKVMGWVDALEAYAYGPLTGGEISPETFFSKSLMPPKLSVDAISALVDYYFDEAMDVSRAWYLLIDLYGGNSSAVSQVSPNETSYAHRGTIFKMEFYDSSLFGDYPSDGFSFLNGWVDAIEQAQGKEQIGMYINYADPTLTTAEAHHLYWLDNYERLSRLKDEFDPNKVFMNPQAVNS